MIPAVKGKIMLVDDQPMNLKLLEEMLRPQGHEVRSFPRGRLALAAAAQNPPDLVLLDINMPEMDGFEVCERLKGNPDLAAIPVIFLSAMDDVESKVKAFRAGGVDYVTKPFQFEEVQARVETHLALYRFSRALEQRTASLNTALSDLEALHRALAKSEGMYRKLVDESEDAVLMAGRDGVITTANRAVVKLLRGAGATDLVGRGLADFAIPNVSIPVASANGEVRSERAAMNARIRCADSTVVDAEVSICSFLDGELRVFSFRDLTARVSVESQVRRLSQAIELAEEAICILGVEGTVLSANVALLHLVHRTEEELQGEHLKMVFDEADAAGRLGAAIAEARTGHSWRGRIASRFGAASLVELDVAVSPVRGETGQIDNLVAVLRNVTREVKMCRDLQLIRGEATTRIGEILIDAGVVSAAAVASALELQKAGDPRPLGEILIDRGTSPAEIVHALNSQVDRFRNTASAVRLAQKTMEALPEQGLPVCSVCQPLADAGGDTFSSMHLPDGSVLMILADVAGHSVLSSYAVASFLGMLLAFAQEWRGLKEFVLRMNASLQAGPFHEIPICVLATQWSPDSGRLHIVSAGIPHSVWLRREPAGMEIVALNGTPLGVLEEPLLEERVLALAPGDRLLLATDGLMEILSPDGILFEDQVAAQWSRLRDIPLCQALPELCEAARKHASGAVTDDILAVAIEQPALEPSTGGFQMRLASTFHDIDEACIRLEQYIRAHAALEHLSEEWRFDFLLAAREALTNAMIHGNGRSAAKRIGITCKVEPEFHTLRLRVTDEGPGFDLSGHSPDSDLQTSLGGRGIPIIRTFAKTAVMTAGELDMQFSIEGMEHEYR